MAADEERILITPCGLYCGQCPLYRARTDEALLQRIAEGQGIQVEEVQVCDGCRPLRGLVPVMSSKVACETYNCAVDDRQVEFCYQCVDFPCLKLAPCADRAEELPHNTKIYNLLCLQKSGIETWLERYADLMRQYRRGKKPRAGDDIKL